MVTIEALLSGLEDWVEAGESAAQPGWDEWKKAERFGRLFRSTHRMSAHPLAMAEPWR